MTSMRDIKRRKGSIESTKQITKAMKLVSTVKLQKTKERAEEANPYFSYMYQTVKAMLARSAQIDHPYLTGRGGVSIPESADGRKNKTGIILIMQTVGLRAATMRIWFAWSPAIPEKGMKFCFIPLEPKGGMH